VDKRAFYAPHSYFLLAFLIGLLVISGYFNFRYLRGEDPISLFSNKGEVEAAQETFSVVLCYYDKCKHTTAGLPDGFQHIDLDNVTGDDIDFLQDRGWHPVWLDDSHLLLKNEGFCPQCAQHYYVGIWNDSGVERIGIYQGYKPHSELVEKLEFEVREDIRKFLQEGISFKTEEEKNLILMDVTS